MEDFLKKAFNVALEATKEASKIQLEYMKKTLDIQTKSCEFDLVTQADKLCEAKIMDVISNAFPEHSFLGEETGENTKESDFLWIIDPIDGTVNYAHRFPNFCSSIALYQNGIPLIGIVNNPCTNECFSAIKNNGAFLNNEQIFVSKIDCLSKALLATGFPALKGNLLQQNLDNFKNFLGKCQAIRRPGSAALDLCYVAAGRIDGFWELGLSPWDTAAGALIVTEAGGKITNIDNTVFDPYIKGLIASNGMLHPLMKEVLL